jgi:hypothetical protein
MDSIYTYNLTLSIPIIFITKRGPFVKEFVIESEGVVFKCFRTPKTKVYQWTCSILGAHEKNLEQPAYAMSVCKYHRRNYVTRVG